MRLEYIVWNMSNNTRAWSAGPWYNKEQAEKELPEFLAKMRGNGMNYELRSVMAAEPEKRKR